uniref:Transcription factor GAGA n=1 Tax=Ceratitis capitata TaxID=7213 RepID=W8B786_CERCA
MFGCIYQLWDWLDAPPLFNAATMDAKKLQQLQQANAQKKLPLAYQTSLVDYRAATHSPVFQQQQAAAMSGYHGGGGSSGYQQSPTATSSSGGPLTPIDMQPQPNKMLLKHMIGSGGNTSSSSHSSPYHQSSSYSGGEQLYQSPTERTYLTAAGRLQATSAHNPASALQQQYQQLQQAKLAAQLQTQNEAAQQQQRTFAMRQALNPPVPQGHFHMSQSSSVMSSMTLQQQQQQQQLQAQQQGIENGNETQIITSTPHIKTEVTKVETIVTMDPNITPISTANTSEVSAGGTTPASGNKPVKRTKSESRSRSQSEQPATCPICYAVIRQSRNLRRHLELRHFAKPGVKKEKKTPTGKKVATTSTGGAGTSNAAGTSTITTAVSTIPQVQSVQSLHTLHTVQVKKDPDAQNQAQQTMTVTTTAGSGAGQQQQQQQ